ncbi:hypothetical protein ABZW18_01880 [Streptomyces sp. NPDC004647]|uniref:hypothetical protein n=1 Tax=Streptomyces sp. NPDC004647 TaxID=3154671 RepID=UPI0033A45E52
MTRSPRSAVAAVAFLAAAATLLTGCGGGGDDSAPAKERPPAAAADRMSPDRSGADGGSSGDSSGKSSGKSGGGPGAAPSDGPKVPKAELTPATGSFTKKQRAYLTDRVPRGTDPAAVLQIGQETCDRITRTAKLDRKAAVSAIRSGEIANAEAAVTHLCPRQLPVLKAAQKGSTG